MLIKNNNLLAHTCGRSGGKEKSRKEKTMKKAISIALVLALAVTLCFGTVALADGPPEGTVNIDMQGDNYGFNVHTSTNHVPWDSFSGNASSTLHMHQTVRYIPSGAWTYDGNDIDRWAHFWGNGRIDVATNYYNPPGGYNDADSILYAYVECTGSEGYLSQNLNFSGGTGGVKDVDQWKKQRDMDIWANGDYELGFGACDFRGGRDGGGNPVNPDWHFDFCAADSGSSGYLYVDDAWTQVQHGGGQWFHPDSFHVNFGFDWVGNAGSQTTWYGEFAQASSPNNYGYDELGDINMSIDIINNFVGGYGEIW